MNKKQKYIRLDELDLEGMELLVKGNHVVVYNKKGKNYTHHHFDKLQKSTFLKKYILILNCLTDDGSAKQQKFSINKKENIFYTMTMEETK